MSRQEKGGKNGMITWQERWGGKGLVNLARDCQGETEALEDVHVLLMARIHEVSFITNCTARILFYFCFCFVTWHSLAEDMLINTS